ncbi:putative esterase [Gordonia effusa NBRC 100432]|uniref:Putative esterase n=1 Tax=Gordonia effusa NBRC 100432 TaxID=1077974 RepID=H0QUU2_9ACTN|nr:putative esterase [Gordonia effusa NBRC 100432]
MWWWIGTTGFVIALSVVGFRTAGWAARLCSPLAIVLAVASTAITADQWTGYFPTVSAAWNTMTAGPLPDQAELADLPSLRGKHTDTGTVVTITTPSNISHFHHRAEYVYLPPAWLSSPAAAPPPRLPVVMMLPGVFNTPPDWMRIGNAIEVVDSYARAHNGQAPILVFADVTGGFRNDTECVNGPRGNVADHLTKEVRPQVISQFGADPSPRSWGIVGWSMGGTCAVDLTLMHPDLFTTFDDIAGDAAPNVGTPGVTLTRLYGGDSHLMAEYDPMVALKAHGPYHGVSAWFEDNGDPGAASDHRSNSAMAAAASEVAAARALCAAARQFKIHCEIHLDPGRHTWQFAQASFAEALDWMVAHLTGRPAQVHADHLPPALTSRHRHR